MICNCSSSINLRQYCTLLQRDDVCHVHGHVADRFYPCSGAEEPQQSPCNNGSIVINITLTPIGPGPWDQKLRSKLTTAQKEGLCSQASCEFRLSCCCFFELILFLYIH